MARNQRSQGQGQRSQVRSKVQASLSPRSRYTVQSLRSQSSNQCLPTSPYPPRFTTSVVLFLEMVICCARISLLPMSSLLVYCFVVVFGGERYCLGSCSGVTHNQSHSESECQSESNF